jgi:5-hydroxyisourate hydrolase
MTVELFRVGDPPERLMVGVTNGDGRLEGPMLEGSALTKGVYELRFHAGEYLRRVSTMPDPSFLDVVPVRFGIAAPEQHYHVPLLLSPYGYATYRGS